MRFIYLMDPMDKVLPDKDTTFAFQRAAQGRGHVALHCELRDLFVREGEVFAQVREVHVSDTAPVFRYGPSQRVRLADVEAVFVRKDPPFDDAYLYATLLLERARNRTVIMNDPRGLRDANEKLYACHFPELMTDTLVANEKARIKAFVADVGGQAVIKPLSGAGGAGVMGLRTGDTNVNAIIEATTHGGRRFAMVQRYLPEVVTGDKRILLLDGEPLGAILRVPRADDLRSNIHVGGRVEKAGLDAADLAIIDGVKNRLRSDGLSFVGLDVIGGKLTEVNVTSPTGIQQMSRLDGVDYADRVIAWIEGRI
mgnify:CR=1 FL=1